jgi:ankyrin repeat protein
MSSSAQLLVELSVFCKSNSLCEGGLREIIQRHGWTPNHPTIPYGFFLSACRNERVTEGILRYLLEYFPGAGIFIDNSRSTSLHIICNNNKNVTQGMVKLLIDAFPASVRNENHKGFMPLHCLCRNENLDDEIGLDILKLLLEKCPESVRHAAEGGKLPIHLAAINQSPEFCRILIEAYPGSERITDDSGSLPFHFACVSKRNTVATAKYFYELYPESISVATTYGCPINFVIFGVKLRNDNPANAVDMVKFLLDHNPDVVLQEHNGNLPLYWTCFRATNENTPTKLNAYLKILQILYDAHPEAVERNAVTTNLDSFPQEVQTFINTRLVYARQSRDHRLMTTRDENGQLPLHIALYDNVDLGSIKLLVKGNPSAICNFDKSGTIPLHVACQHHKSADVVQYLIGLGEDTLDAMDKEGNTALHYACRGANHATITLLLEKYGAISVSKRNSHNQLPVDLLFESEAVNDREGVKYTESIFQLLRSYPATVMNCISNITQHPNSKISGRKRKVDNM